MAKKKKVEGLTIFNFISWWIVKIIILVFFGYGFYIYSEEGIFSTLIMVVLVTFFVIDDHIRLFQYKVKEELEGK
jgi:hypothetical protein